MKDKSISISAKLVYAYLSDIADRSEYRLCYPHRRTIARDMGLSLRTVASALKELGNAGFIDISPDPGRGNIYAVKEYDEICPKEKHTRHRK